MLCSLFQNYPLAPYVFMLLAILFLVYRNEWGLLSTGLLGCTLLAGAQTATHGHDTLLFFVALDVVYVLYTLLAGKILKQQVLSFGLFATCLLLSLFVYHLIVSGLGGKMMGVVFLSSTLTMLFCGVQKHKDEVQ